MSADTQLPAVTDW